MRRLAAATALAELLALAGLFGIRHLLGRDVAVLADGGRVVLRAGGESVAGLLKREGLGLGPLDEVEPPAGSPARQAAEIRVRRHDRRIYVSSLRLPRRVIRRTTDRLHVAEVVDLRLGEDGLRASEERIDFTDGTESARQSVKMRTLRPPQDALVLVGTSLQKRPYMMEKRMAAAKEMDLEATAYYPGAESSAPYDDGYTALGYKAGYGVAAVDTKMIKLRSKLYVEGYGFALAVDRGGDIRKGRIDLCFNTLEEAKAFGRKKVKVYVLQ